MLPDVAASVAPRRAADLVRLSVDRAGRTGSGAGRELLDASATSPNSARAAFVIARAIGCSLAASSAPAIRSTSSRAWPSTGRTSTSVIAPVVTVPVLSSTIVSTRRVDSSTSGPLISSPSWAPRPVPTSSAVGVARPSAHGQAMISTDDGGAERTVARRRWRASHPTSVSSASPITIGTNTAEMRSARRCTGALPDWASSTRRAICASWVSAPTRVARTISRPWALIVAPVTSSPGATSTGTLSPVTSERSIADAPSTTTPSVATFSPGRTTNRSPTASSPIGTRRSLPSSSSTATSLAPRSSRARRASPARRLARASK